MATIDELVVELSADVKKLKSALDSAEKHVKGYEKDVVSANKKVDQSFKSAGVSIKSVLGPLAAAASAYAAVDKLISEGQAFAVMSAQLKTATGSAEAAAKEFTKLEQFAAETPFLLQQSIDAFTKLTNLGLTPSQEAMMSYGNTASAMGKDLNQMIEAVADATTGEFERLKEFGIKSKSQGDEVSFTFRGVTTTIGKNAAEIENYLMALGENEFAGAMADRMATLDGAISNLQDTWDSLFRNILASGVGNIIESGFRGATDALQEFMEFTGLAEKAPVVYNETADAAIRLASAQERLAQLNKDNAGKEAKFLEIIKKVEVARDRQIEQVSQNVTDERALNSIREGFTKRYQVQIDALTEAYKNSSQINSELRQKEIAELNSASEAINSYVAANEQKIAQDQAAVSVEFAEDIGAASFEKRIEYLQEHNLLVWEITNEHNRRVEDAEEESAKKRANTIKILARTTLNSARNLGDNLTEVMRRSGHEQSAVAKAIFLAQKGIDVATIISATEVAAAKAAAVAAAGGPVSFFATAKAIRAFGYANAALVAGLGVHSALSSGGATGGGSGGGGAAASTGTGGYDGSFFDDTSPETGIAGGPVVTVNIYGNAVGDNSVKELIKDGVYEAIDTQSLNLQTSSGERVVRTY